MKQKIYTCVESLRPYNNSVYGIFYYVAYLCVSAGGEGRLDARSPLEN